MRLRAAVPVAVGIFVVATVPAFAAKGTPPASKPAAALAAGAKASPAPVDSLTVLERAVAKDSTNFDNLYKLGVMYMDRERTPEALRVLEKAVAGRPNDLKALVNLGAAHDAMGNAGAAQRHYRKALGVAPGDSVATCRLASSLYAQQNYKESMDLLRQLIADKPRSHCAYFTLGVAFADAGLYRDAIRSWQKVVELAPESAEAVSAHESIEVLSKYLTGQANQ